METRIPVTIGIIMDGNRRYAKERNLPTLEGHRRGLDKVKEMLGWAEEAGVKNVILYTFSTENWNRSAEEVEYLFSLFRKAIQEFKDELRAKHPELRLRFLGDRTRFPEDMQVLMNDAEQETVDGIFTLALAMNYGGRAEIMQAIHRIPSDKLTTLTEQEFSALLYTDGIPDPDIILRTSGEERLSGFLPWQSIYSELFFITTHWPAFTREEFDGILKSYAARNRRFGK